MRFPLIEWVVSAIRLLVAVRAEVLRAPARAFRRTGGARPAPKRRAAEGPGRAAGTAGAPRSLRARRGAAVHPQASCLPVDRLARSPPADAVAAVACWGSHASFGGVHGSGSCVSPCPLRAPSSSARDPRDECALAVLSADSTALWRRSQASVVTGARATLEAPPWSPWSSDGVDGLVARTTGPSWFWMAVLPAVDGANRRRARRCARGASEARL